MQPWTNPLKRLGPARCLPSTVQVEFSRHRHEESSRWRSWLGGVPLIKPAAHHSVSGRRLKPTRCTHRFALRRAGGEETSPKLEKPLKRRRQPSWNSTPPGLRRPERDQAAAQLAELEAGPRQEEIDAAKHDWEALSDLSQPGARGTPSAPTSY